MEAARSSETVVYYQSNTTTSIFIVVESSNLALDKHVCFYSIMTIITACQFKKLLSFEIKQWYHLNPQLKNCSSQILCKYSTTVFTYLYHTISVTKNHSWRPSQHRHK